jgi:hypothetical protein
MPFVVQCPFCSVKANVPDHAHGGVGKCPRCGSSFSMARPVTPEPRASAKKRGNAEAEKVPSAPPKEDGTMQAAAPRIEGDHSLPAVHGRFPVSQDESPQSAEDRQLHTWGVISLFFAAEGLLFASISFLTLLTIPLCILGLSAALLGGFVAEPRNKSQMSWLVAGGSFSFVLLTVAILWPAALGANYYWGRQ